MLGSDHAEGHPVLTDLITGLGNRLHFEVVYSYLFAGADRGVPLTVMLVSVSVSDRDELAELGSRIQLISRSSDLVAHLGDGRFIFLLLGCNLPGALLAADRFEEAFGKVTTTKPAIGLAPYRDDHDEPEELLEAVGGAVEASEKSGRVEIAE